MVLWCEVIDFFAFLEKTGRVKEEAFFTILRLHGVDLKLPERNRLTKNFSRAGMINFTEALQQVNIDLDSAILREEKWTVPKDNITAKMQAAQHSINGRAVSHLSRLSLQDFNER